MASLEKKYLHYLILASIIAILNVVFCMNQAVGTMIAIVEVFVLLMYVMVRDIAGFISVYLIFICNCMEFSQFVGNESFYNIKSIRIGGVNIAAWMLIILMLSVCIKPIRISYVRNSEYGVYRFGKNLVIINTIAAIIGMIVVAINDNGIRNIPNYLSEYLGFIYSCLFIPLSIVLGILYVITYEKGNQYKLFASLQATIVANAIQVIFSFVFGYYGRYGGVDTLLASTLYFLLPLVILLSGESHFVFKGPTLFIILIGTALSLVFNANGKTIITVAIVSIVVVLRMLKDRNVILKLLSIILVIAGIIMIPSIIAMLLQKSIIFQNKFIQSKSVFNIFDRNWLINLPQSPRSRIEEIIDVFIELWEKPWFVITGKGYMGSIVDHTGFFSSLIRNNGIFSANEWSYKIFYNLHEIANNVLMFGIVGVVYSVSLILYTRKHFNNNRWILIGVYWFLLLFGYSFTLSTFGVTALTVGLLSNESANEKITS